ncbi:MAG: PDZ domain-containing protein [Verrucomicrobiales bacterium]|nr:PDZ domain-containing protein [Verrucomicrobiales bacterium]
MKTVINLMTIALLSISGVSSTYAEDGEPRSQYDAETPGDERGSNEKITFLGVSTFHLAPSLRAHLEIPEGFGIQVHDVIANSPAESAGLKKNDILLRFDDQTLISPEHLSLLVKEKGDAAQVELTVIRKGTEETVSVALGRIDKGASQIRPRIEGHRMSPEQWQEHVKQQQDYWERWMDKRQPANIRDRKAKNPDAADPNPTGRPPSLSVRPGFPVRVFGTEGVIKIDNDEGEVSITHEDDGHVIVIKDIKGEEIYSGSYDADLGIEGLPEEARIHLKKMKLDSLKILTPQVAEDTPEKISSPMPPPSLSEREEVL